MQPVGLTDTQGTRRASGPGGVAPATDLGQSEPTAAQPVPEPATMLLFGAGMTCVALYRRRRLDLEPIQP